MIEIAGVAASMACRYTRFLMTPNAAQDHRANLCLQSVSLVGVLLGCAMAHWDEYALLASAKPC
jgi:hypothetical protein